MNVPETVAVTSRATDRRKVAIIGAGSWGTAVARVIAENHPELSVVIWAREKEVVRSINERHVNSVFLPQVILPSNIMAVASQREAVEGSYAVLIATPSRVVHDFVQKLKKLIPEKTCIGYLSKGFCRVHHEILTISQAIERVMPEAAEGLTAICGPSHAEEVSSRYNTTLNVASRSPRARREFVRLLQSPYIECRETDDVIGVDLGSTLKNPAAIAAGMLSMLPGCGDNLAGTLVSESLQEMLHLGKALGARDETILGIAGLGDMVATALSDHSRNRRFGRDIASQVQRGGSSIRFYDMLVMRFKPEYVIEKMSQRLNYLAEGAYAIEPIIELAGTKSIQIPVYRALYEVLLNKRDAQLLIETVKNPSKFEELYGRVKIQTREKKKGMEQASAYLFENVVVERTLSRLDTPDYRENIIDSKEHMSRLMANACNTSNRPKTDLKLAEREASLYSSVTNDNYRDMLTRIIKLHYRSISDRHSYMMYRIISVMLRAYSYLVKLKTGDSAPLRPVITSGELKAVQKAGRGSTIVYSLEGKYCYSALFVTMGFSKYPELPKPRVLMDERVVRSGIWRYLLRKAGMYMVCPEKLASPVYREVMFQYLCTMVEHGVSVCYIHPGKIDSTGDRALLEHMLQLLQATTEEIAIVPLSLSLYHDDEAAGKRKDGFPSTGDVIRNQARIYMSSPMYLSDYSHAEEPVDEMKNVVIARRPGNLSLYEHHVLAYVLCRNNYHLSVKEARKTASSLLAHELRGSGFTARRIVSKGSSFLVKNNIVTLENGELRTIDRASLDLYASHVNA